MSHHLAADQHELSVGEVRGPRLTRRRFISGAGSTVALAGTEALISGCETTT